MAHLHATKLLGGPLVQISDVVCRAPRSGCGEEEHVESVRLMLPRRGVFALHRGRELVAAAPATAVLLGAGDIYRVSHPADGGDACTVLVYGGDTTEEAFAGAWPSHGALSPATQLRAAKMMAALARDDPLSWPPDTLAAEEAALGLLGAIAGDLVGAPAPRVGAGGRRRVEEVRLLLAASPGERWRLDALAGAVHTSPFHLARQFRAVTGETIARSLLRIRLALALERLAEGEDDLARLGVDLGFSHHSHFTARFRAAFGEPPSRMRKLVTAGERRAP